MYENYYASPDVQLYFKGINNGKLIKIDTAVSIGYSLRQASSPVYSLGSRLPQFYTKGLTLGNGTITIAFTDEYYLKYCLEEVCELNIIDQTLDTNSVDSSGNVRDNIVTTDTRKVSNAEFKKLAENKKDPRIQSEDANRISIGSIDSLFDIQIFLNNETAIRASDSKSIVLSGIKIINESLNSTTTADAPLLLSYNFMFKDLERG